MMSSMPSAFPPASVSNIDTILTLPQQTGSLAIADACRVTALAFLNEALHWGKAELAMWLMGPYGQLTQYVSPFSSRRSGEHVRTAPLMREIDARMVDRVIRAAHDEVMSTLSRIDETEGGASFAFTMLAAGFVARCEDRGQVAGWVPTSDARRLADRVLSLFAVDYLSRPGHYENDLSVCRICKAVEFDAVSHDRGVCHRHDSGMFTPSRRRHTLPYLPEGA
jgi:hypothetical protein